MSRLTRDIESWATAPRRHRNSSDIVLRELALVSILLIGGLLAPTRPGQAILAGCALFWLARRLFDRCHRVLP